MADITGDYRAPGSQPGDDLGAAARLLYESVKNNPFMSMAGRTRLSQGLLPNLNDVQAAFNQYTSPVITQSLAGLFQSGGVPLAEQDFYRNIWTPLGR